MTFGGETGKTTKYLSQDSLSLSRDLNPGLPEQRTGVLTTQRRETVQRKKRSLLATPAQDIIQKAVTFLLKSTALILECKVNCISFSTDIENLLLYDNVSH
jgi:hypothetical protein